MSFHKLKIDVHAMAEAIQAIRKQLDELEKLIQQALLEETTT